MRLFKQVPAWMMCTLTLVAFGCGGEDKHPETPGEENKPPAGEMTSLRFVVEQTTLPLAGSVSLVIEGVYASGATEDVTDRVSLSSSDDAIISLEGARARATSAGSATVTATLNALSAALELTVLDVTLEALEVQPASIRLAAGTSRLVTCTAIYTEGIKLDVSGDATFSLEGEAPESASFEGARLSALTPGSATVRCAFQEQSATASLTVTDATLVSLTVEASAPAVPRGASTTLNAVGIFSDATRQTLSDQVTWSFSEEIGSFFERAQDNGAQILTGSGVGTLEVTATKGEISGTISLDFRENQLETLRIFTRDSILLLQQDVVTLPAGTRTEVVIQGEFENGVLIDLTGSPIITLAVAAASVAEVVREGQSTFIKAKAPGDATLTVTSQSGVTATRSIKVSNAVLTGIEIEQGQAQMPVGTQRALRAIGTYSDGGRLGLTAVANWSSSAPGIASVSNSIADSGRVVAASAGSVTITAAVGGFSDTFAITVTPAVLTGLRIEGPDEIILGLSADYVAIGTYDNGTERVLTADATWGLDEGFALLSNLQNPGRVTTTREGALVLYAAVGGQRATLNVDVVADSIASLAVQSPLDTIAPETVLAFRAIATLQSGATKDVTNEASWSVPLDDNIGDVILSSGNPVRGLYYHTANSGTVPVSASVQGFQATKNLVVSAATLSSMEVVSGHPFLGGANIVAGDRFTLRVVGTFSDSSTQDITGSCFFTGFDEHLIWETEALPLAPEFTRWPAPFEAVLPGSDSIDITCLNGASMGRGPATRSVAYTVVE